MNYNKLFMVVFFGLMVFNKSFMIKNKNNQYNQDNKKNKSWEKRNNQFGIFEDDYHTPNPRNPDLFLNNNISKKKNKNNKKNIFYKTF